MTDQYGEISILPTPGARLYKGMTLLLATPPAVKALFVHPDGSLKWESCRGRQADIRPCRFTTPQWETYNLLLSAAYLPERLLFVDGIADAPAASE